MLKCPSAMSNVLAAPVFLLFFSFELAGLSHADSCPQKPLQIPAEVTYPPNLDQLKFRLLNYKCFGQYEREIERVITHAIVYVQKRAGQVMKPALVLDIDETSLSN